MKNNNDYMSDTEILMELLKCLLRMEKKMPDGNKPTLADLGFITNDDFMKMLNIKRGKADQLRRSGTLRYSKMGGIIVYKISDVIDMLNKHFERH